MNQNLALTGLGRAGLQRKSGQLTRIVGHVNQQHTQRGVQQKNEGGSAGSANSPVQKKDSERP